MAFTHSLRLLFTSLDMIYTRYNLQRRDAFGKGKKGRTLYYVYAYLGLEEREHSFCPRKVVFCDGRGKEVV